MMGSKSSPWEGILTRGLTLIQFRRYLVEKLGHKETEEVISILAQDTADVIRNVKKGEWYPFEVQRQLREGIIQHVDSDDPLGVMYRMGLVTASWDFSTLLKPFFSFLSAELILNRSAVLWSKYYDHGEVKVKIFKEGYALLELSDFPSDPHFPPIVTSWMTVALQTLKKKNPRVEHSRCSRNGGELDCFELRWD